VIVLVVVLLAAAAAGGAFLLLSDDDDRSPEDTVRALFTAIQDRDCEALVDLYTDDSWAYLASFDEDTPDDIGRDEALQLCRDQIEEDGDEEFTDTLDEVQVTSQDGDQAVLDVTTTTADGEQSTDTVVVTREDGTWRFDLPATDERASNASTESTEP
jgi:ketosteroid isomerase-like protein